MPSNKLRVSVCVHAKEYNADSSPSSGIISLLSVSLREYVNVGRHKKSLCRVYREMNAISSISTVVPASPVG